MLWFKIEIALLHSIYNVNKFYRASMDEYNTAKIVSFVIGETKTCTTILMNVIIKRT